MVPISGLTAIRPSTRRGSRRVVGARARASGGVGSYAVQLAKGRGAEVTGVCSTAKVDLVRSLGADHVIAYDSEDPTAPGQRYDAIIDIGGNTRLGSLRRALAPRGTLVIVGGEGGDALTGGLDRQLRARLLPSSATRRSRRSSTAKTTSTSNASRPSSTRARSSRHSRPSTPSSRRPARSTRSNRAASAASSRSDRRPGRCWPLPSGRSADPARDRYGRTHAHPKADRRPQLARSPRTACGRARDRSVIGFAHRSPPLRVRLRAIPITRGSLDGRGDREGDTPQAAVGVEGKVPIRRGRYRPARRHRPGGR